MATTTRVPAARRAVQIESEVDSVPAESAVSEPAPEEIARLAYSYWLDHAEDGQGSAEADWLRAESDLRRPY